MAPELAAADLDQLVRLHYQSFPHDFINLLGRGMVRRWYAQALAHPGAESLAERRDGLVRGFVLGLPACREFYAGFQRRNLPALLWGTGLAVLARPARLGRVLAAARFDPGPDYGREGMELAYIAVDPGLRGQGLGADLTRRLIQAGRRRGDRWLWTKTHADNPAGNRLYLGCGFREAGRVWLGRVEQVIYRKDLG